MEKEKLILGLTQFCAREIGEGQLSGLCRLSGGATMESWSFDYGEADNMAGYVLRRAPSAEMMQDRPFGLETEARLVQKVVAGGVIAPHVIGILGNSDVIGSGYVMKRVEAEVNPEKILPSPPDVLLADIAGQLAKIHTIRPSDDIDIPKISPVEMLVDFKARFAEYGGDRPVIALAIKWCEDNLPEDVSPVLVHGDYRMGNLMVDQQGLAAVLDWELAHWGDSHDDLAYGCLNVWRFGRIDKPAFGLGSLDAFFAAYEAAAGQKVDHERFRFWFIFRTLWWALGCLQMTSYWRSGADRNLERAVIGRRTSENELDLLMLLEEEVAERMEAQVEEAAIEEPRRIGEASAVEMLEAVSEWIASDVKSHAEGRGKFMAAVAINALGMVRRELTRPADIYNRDLCDDILAGRATLATPGLLQKLRAGALGKLANDVPKYASLQKARELWENDPSLAGRNAD